MSAAADLGAFSAALSQIPSGYREVTYRGRRYSMTLRRSGDGKRDWLYAEALDGSDVVSFNLYHLVSGDLALRPCEMPSAKVIDFVVNSTIAGGSLSAAP